MELTQKETDDIHRAYEELRAVKDTNDELRKLVANVVSEYRRLAKDAEDLGNKLYEKASFFEDKARAL